MSSRSPFRRLAFNLARGLFRLAPMPVLVRDRLRHAFLARHGDLVPTGPEGKPPMGSVHRAYVHDGQPLIRYMPRRPGTLPDHLPATVVAFYLPQFHPVPENDAWWGPGFTEWRNVARALPQFEGHAQPRLPGDLGFYDLRVPDVMAAQARLAREYGVGAFCTYFYWFAGKTLLEAPLRRWLNDPALDLPIALCWANENWSRRWDGRADDILIGQAHSAEDDLAFIAYVADYLRDPRYLRVDGRPMLLVYRPGLLPDPAATAARWRDWCRTHGVGEIHLAYVQSFDRVPPASIGFDAAVAFPPNNTSLRPITGTQRLLNPHYRGDVLDWRELAADAMSAPDPAYRLYPGVNPGWDNEARRSGRGRTYIHATPRGFERWTRHAIETARRRSPTAPLVFVNAWNEWAEGAVLEPDARDGHGWLEAVRRAMVPAAAPQRRPCAVIHVWYPELLAGIVGPLRASALPMRIVLTVPHEKELAVRAELARLELDAEIVAGPNRGRDILPFLRVAQRLRDEGEDVVLKLHTKQSTHREDGAAWRAELVGRLASPARLALVAQAFADNATLGMVAPEGHVQRLDYFWGANAGNVEFLCNLAGIPQPSVQGDTFIAGSMFWCRLQALEPLLDAPLSDTDFDPEDGQVDGTLAHAIERVFALAARHARYTIMSGAAIAGEPEPSGDYAYARKNP